MATTLAPSAYPVRFQTLVEFRYPYGPNWPDWTGGVGGQANPKGITYNATINKLIVHVAPNSASIQGILRSVNLSLTSYGAHDRFGSIATDASLESKLIAVPPSGPPVASAGFTADDVFVPTTTTNNQVARVNSAGTVLNANFYSQGSGSYGPWGGLAFDTAGTKFGGDLLIHWFVWSGGVTSSQLWRVNGAGTKSQVGGDLSSLGRPEGLVVAPASGFGPHSGKALIGIEGSGNPDTQSGKIYAVDQTTQTEFANIGFTAETLLIAPAYGGTLFVCELNFFGQRDNRVMMVPASQWLARRGRLIVFNELGAEFWEVFYDSASSDYKQRNIGRSPGPWSTSGWTEAQGTEIEAGCFAVLPPTEPDWGSYATVNPAYSGFRAKGPPALARTGNELHFFAVSTGAGGYGADKVHRARYNLSTSSWLSDWQVVSNTTVASPDIAAAYHEGRILVFAATSGTAQNISWLDAGSIPGTWLTVATAPSSGATLSAPAAAVANGRLVVMARWAEQNAFVVSELPAGGFLAGVRAFSDFSTVPNSNHDSLTGPGVGYFQGELWLLKVLSSKIYASALWSETPPHIAAGWTEWGEIPTDGSTPRTAHLVATTSGGLLATCRGVDSGGSYGAPHSTVSSHLGTWLSSGWNIISGLVKDLGNPAIDANGKAHVAGRGGDDVLYFWSTTSAL